MSLRSLAAFSLILATASTAQADAWSAASQVIPGGMSIVMGVDVAAIRNSALDPVVQQLLDRPLDHGLREITEQCGFNLWAKTRSVVFAADTDGTGAAYIDVGLSKQDILACGRKLIASEQKLSIEESGDLIVINAYGKAQFAVGWKNGVLVVAFYHLRLETNDRYINVLKRMISGPGASKDAILIRGLRDVSTSAALWMIWGDRLDWNGRELGRPRRVSALTSPTLVAQGGFTGAVPTASSDDERRAPMLYATGELQLSSHPKAKLTGFFKTDAEWVRDGVQQEIHREADDDLAFAKDAKITASNNRVIITNEFASIDALVALLKELH